MINQELLRQAKEMDVSFGEGEDMTLKALIGQLEKYINILNDIIVKDNRRINNLDKENEANKQRIEVLERAVSLAEDAYCAVCRDTNYSDSCNNCPILEGNHFKNQAKQELTGDRP